MPALDAKRALHVEGQPDEDEPGEAVPHRRVREWQQPVREDVLRHAQVERPEKDRGQEHELHGRRPAHAADATGTIHSAGTAPHSGGPQLIRG